MFLQVGITTTKLLEQTEATLVLKGTANANQVKAAVLAVKGGLSIRKADEKYGLSKSAPQQYA